jgi:hypothetical protein
MESGETTQVCEVGTTLEKHIYVDDKDKLKKQKNYLYVYGR